MTLRRSMLASGALAAIGAIHPALAQSMNKVRRIGLLLNEIAPDLVVRLLKPPLAELGYEEGRHYTLEARFAQAQWQRLDDLAAELVRLPVDVIVAPRYREIAAARRATARIPIVMMYGRLPVESGLIASLAHPGGNVTGTTTNAPELAGKMLQVLCEAVPGLRRTTVLIDPVSAPAVTGETERERIRAADVAYVQQMEHAGKALNLRLDFQSAGTGEELDAALATLERHPPEAMLVQASGPMVIFYQRIFDFALRMRVPYVYAINMTKLGGLMSYSPDFVELARRNAWMIDRIFKGTLPADIPVEQPSRFRLDINLSTAKAMGLTLPKSLLARADGLVE